MEHTTVSKMADEAASRLMEHCDSVRIFITFHEGGEEKTLSYEVGKGNFYAQYGQVVEWLSMQQQYSKNYADRKDSASE